MLRSRLAHVLLIFPLLFNLGIPVFVILGGAPSWAQEADIDEVFSESGDEADISDISDSGEDSGWDEEEDFAEFSEESGGEAEAVGEGADEASEPENVVESEETGEMAEPAAEEEGGDDFAAEFEEVEPLEEDTELQNADELLGEESPAGGEEQLAEPTEPPMFDEPAAEPLEPAEPAYSQAPPVNDEPNFAYEAKLHQIFVDFYASETPQEQWSAVAAERQSEIYEIQNGDTLWDISATLFGDGNYWPKVWSLNGKITNPHLIKPGHRIQFLLGDLNDAPAFTVTEATEEEVTTEVTEEEQAAEEGGEQEVAFAPGVGGEEEELEIPSPSFTPRPVVMELPPSLPSWQDTVTGAGKYDDAGIDYGRRKILDVKNEIPLTAYVSEKIPEEIGVIHEVEVGNRVATAYQYVFVRMRKGQAKVGDKLLVIQNQGQLISDNPDAGGDLGYAVEIQGEIVLTERTQSEEEIRLGETFRALVTRIVNPVTVGSSVLMGEIRTVEITEKGPTKDVQAFIVGGQFSNRRKIIGSESLVYLNKGQNDGLTRGDILPIRANRKLRNSTSQVLENLRPLGWLRVVDVNATSSTAIIVRAWSDILTGDVTGFGPIGKIEIPDSKALSPETLELLERARAQRGQQGEDSVSEPAEETFDGDSGSFGSDEEDVEVFEGDGTSEGGDEISEPFEEEGFEEE